MIVALFVTTRLERWLELAQRNAAATFEFTPVIWATLGVNLLIALMWFSLSWWVIVKVRRSWLVAAVYILAWLLMAALPTFFWTAPEGIRSFLREGIGPLQNLPLTNLAGLAKANILVMGLYLLVSPWLRRVNLNIVLLPPALFILLLAACQPSGSPSGRVENFSLRDRGTLWFPRQPETDVHMTALLEGQLILDNGCLRATTEGYEESGFLVIWPAGAAPRFLGDGTIEVLDVSGEIVTRVGEPISLGGGAMESDESMRFWEQQIEGLPIEGCPGPYWVAGELN